MMPEQDEEGSKNRVSPRNRVLKGAYAAFNHEFSAIPCIVRDISDTGARLVFEDGWFVPDRFMLFIEVDGFKIECERVWYKGGMCGVRFLGERIRIANHRPQVLKPYEDTGDESAAAPRAEWGKPIGGAPTMGGRRPVQFGKRTR